LLVSLLGCLSWWIRCLRIWQRESIWNLAQSRSLLSRWRNFEPYREQYKKKYPSKRF
jgi:hypothetical protein